MGEYFGQEPSSPLGLVNPVFNRTGGGHVGVPVTDLMGLPQKAGKFEVVRSKRRYHLFRAQGLLVVVFESLVFRNVADGSKRSPLQHRWLGRS
jgi:hypothetical protein